MTTTLLVDTLKSDLDNFIRDLIATDGTESPKVYNFDLLEAACVLKDLAPSFTDISSPSVQSAITPEIKTKAAEIRKYYTRRWFWSSLNSIQLSPFRQRAQYLLESRTREVQKNDIGIYVKLPWFYEEDMIYEDFKTTLITSDIPHVAVRGKQIIEVTYLRNSHSWQGKRKITRYWFKNDQNYLFNIEVAIDNPLVHVFEDAIAERATCKFETFLKSSRIDQMYFYNMFNFKLVKE
jgi:hypothetical protein